jgi:hypothetical protein
MAAAAENVTPIEKEAANEPYSFEFADERWELVEHFNLLDFQELLEDQKIIGAFKYALGEDYDAFKEVAGGSASALQEATEALVQAVGLGGPGESRASRRSSARKRPARR